MAISEELWRPISLSRDGPKLTYLYFADGLLIFTEASLDQVEVINDYLDIFCTSSGQKVGKEKTRIYFSKNVHHV